MILTSADSVTDEMLRFDCDGGSIYVHRQLVCDRSEGMNEATKQSEEVIESTLSKINEGSWYDHWLSKRGWELYIGFLYGHPIWTRSKHYSIEEDFKHLADICDHGRSSDTDQDAADAAMDAIRDLVLQHGDALSRPFNILEKMEICDFECEEHSAVRLLADFMVYGQSGYVFGKWYDAYMTDYKDGCLDAELGVRFTEKAIAKSRKGDLPNLLERCKYHLHRNYPDQCCYLEK